MPERSDIWILFLIERDFIIPGVESDYTAMFEIGVGGWYMKRMAIFVLVLLLLITSCSMSRKINVMKDADAKRVDNRLQEILIALSDRDKERIKSMFSKQALTEAENFDEHLDYLLEFFQEEIPMKLKLIHLQLVCFILMTLKVLKIK